MPANFSFWINKKSNAGIEKETEGHYNWSKTGITNEKFESEMPGIIPG